MADNDRSILWPAAAWGSVLGGIGYGAYKYRSSFQDAFRKVQDVASESVSAVSSMPGFAQRPPVPSGIPSNFDAVMSAINNIEAGGVNLQSGDLTSIGYKAIMSGGVASHEKAMEALSGMGNLSSSDAYRTLLKTVQAEGGNVDLVGKEILSRNNSVIDSAITVSKGIDAGSSAAKDVIMAASELSPEALGRFNTIRDEISGALTNQGLTDSASYRLRTVGDLPMATVDIGDVSFNLPLEDRGYTYQGKNLTSKYITRKGYSASGRVMSYSDLATKTISDAISGSSNNSAMKEKLRQANESLIQSMRDRDSANRAAAVWTYPDEVLSSGGRAKAKLIAQEAVPYRVGLEGSSSLLSQGFFPYVSPGAAGKGILSTGNLAEDLFGPLGKFYQSRPELRPGQFIRSEWGVSEAAKKSMPGFKGTFGQHYSRFDRKVKGSGYNKILYGSAAASSAEAYSAPQLMTFYAKHGDVGWANPKLNHMLSAEQGVISSNTARFLEYERVVQKKIALDAGLQANARILSGLEGTKLGQFVSMSNIGGFVGVEKGTGSSLSLDSPGSSIIGAELTGSNEARVYIRERHRLEQGQMFKFFSEENKYMGSSVDDMSRYLQAAGYNGALPAGDIEAMFSSKVLSRNPMALITQQTEALSKFASTKGMTPEIQRFLSDPAAALNVSGIMKEGTMNEAFQIQKNLVGLAGKFGLTNQEMASTFGLMDSGSVTSLMEQGLLSPSAGKAIQESAGVIGLGKMFLGDLASEGGAGRRPTFEQSGFRMLAMQGQEGMAFGSELMTRIEGHGKLSGLEKMEATVLGDSSLFGRLKRGSSAEDFINLTEKNLVQQEGRFVNLGRSIAAFGGSSELYVPGTNEVGDLLSPRIIGGEEIDSPISRAMMSLKQTMGGTAEEIESAAEGLRRAVAQETAAQASGRGKILGARIFTGMVKENVPERTRGAFHVSTKMADEMYSELINRSNTAEQKAFLTEQLNALKSGESVIAGMWRHPATGPKSFQFARLAIDSNLADGLVAAPTEYGKIKFQDGRIQDIDLSEMVGFKGDFDNDKYNIAAISTRSVADKARRQYANGTRAEYNKYLFNHYSMQDIIKKKLNTKQMLEVTGNRAMQQGFEKLFTAKAVTGKVNVALQKFKLATAAYAPEEYSSLAEMFFHLEETAISGKKGTAIGQSSLFKAIEFAANENTGRDEAVNALTGAIEGLLGGEETITGSMFNEAGESLGDMNFKKDPRRWSEVSVDALRANNTEINQAMRQARIAKGKGTSKDFGLNELREIMNARKQASIDPSIAMAQAAYGSSNMESKAGSLINKARSKGNRFFGALNKARGPMLLGAAAAAGIMLMAPSSAGKIGSAPRMSGGQGMRPEDFGPPDGGQGMNPPPPRPNISPRTYDTGGIRQTSRVNIRMRSNDLNRSSRDFMQSARDISNGGQVHVRARDDRAALDSHMLANRIQERL